MARTRTVAIAAGVGVGAAIVFLVARHCRGSLGRSVTGGILIRDAGAYDAFCHGPFLGPLFDGIAANAAAVAPAGARVLEVGCGPGRLSIALAQRGFDVTGLDLDPAMIERAGFNAERLGEDEERRPAFLVGDVASLAFADESFDLVVSTLSMHHWADVSAGLAEIGRVLRPGGRALVWDLRPAIVPFHGHVPDPVEHGPGPSLRVASARPWRWPWRLALTRRIELVRTDAELEPARR